MLALVLRGSIGATYGIVQPPQLAFGARVHVAHAADHAVRLVVEIEAVGDELLQLDLRRALEAGAIATPAVVAATSRPVVPARASAAFAGTSTLALAFPRRPPFPVLCFLLLCHPLTLAQQSGPLQGDQTGRAQLDLRRAASYDFADQVR